jgi:hypothetical protein
MPLPLYDLRIFEGVSSLTVEIIKDHARMHVVDPTRERGSTRGRAAEDLMTLFRLTDVIRKSANEGRPCQPTLSFKWSGHRDSAVIVAVPLIRMMHVAFDDVVGMTAVWNRLMSATGTMSMLTVVRTARMSRSTSGRIRATLRQGMFIYVPLVSTVKMPLMQIVDVTLVFDRRVSAAWTVRMGMLVVCFVVAHFH